MVGTEILLRAVAAAVGVAFAAALVPAARRSRAALWLAAFLLLVAINQAAETVRGLRPPDAAHQLPWFRLASAAASLDPLALYLFASYARPAAMREPRRLLLVAIPSLGLAGWSTVVAHVPFIDDPTFHFPFALSLFTIVVYLGLLFWALEGMLREPERAAWRPLFAAIAFLAVPFSAVFFTNIPTEVRDAVEGTLQPWASAAIGSSLSMGGALGIVLAVAIVARGRSDPAQRALLAWVGGACLLLALLIEAQSLDAVAHTLWGVPYSEATGVTGHAVTAIRFLLFGMFASAALVRHDALDLSLAQRRRAARVLIGLACVIAAASAIPLLEIAVTGAAGALTTLDVILLIGVVVLSQGFQRSVDFLAERLYAVPRPGDAAAAHETYRRAVVDALDEGRSPAEDPALARLREELALDDATAALLARLADEGAGGPLREGISVGGRYKVERFLGAGGSGRAFLAQDATLRRRVVLKEVRDTGDGGDEAALAEARVAGGLASPHIVAMHGAFRRRGAWILVMEHAEGGSLEELLRAGPLAPARAETLLREIVRGVAVVHAKGIVHGDLKPRNVLLAADGRARIADFGLARLARGRTAPIEGAVAGTPDYLAPEQRRGLPATARSDVFALGLLARRLCADGFPAAVEAVLRRATEADPEARFADAGEMLAALEARAPGQRQ